MDDSAEARINEAMECIERYGSIDGEHHKTWVLDQVVRALLADGYARWVRVRNSDEDYRPWDCGIAP